MLEPTEKLHAGAPAASEQLCSSWRYPRASENSLWGRLVLGQAARPRASGRALALHPPQHSLPSWLRGARSPPARLVGDAPGEEPRPP